MLAHYICVRYTDKGCITYKTLWMVYGQKQVEMEYFWLYSWQRSTLLKR